MLSDLKRLAAREDIDPGRLRQAAAVLLARQFLYSDTQRDRSTYLLLVSHRGYFDLLFDALNHDFLYDQELGMVGILPRGKTTSLRFKKEEALLLLTLRLIYEQSLESFTMKNGCAYTNSEQLIAKYQLATGAELRPLLTDLRRMLTDFKRFGLIDDIQEEDSRILNFRIRPAVRHVLNEGWFRVLEQHAGIISEEEADEDEMIEVDLAAEDLAGEGQ